MSRETKQKARERAIADAVEQHHGRLSRIVRAMTRDRSEAEDVLQETFEELINAYDVGETIETMGAWLSRVARNKIVDRFRRHKKQTEYRLIVQSTEEASAPTDEGTRQRFRAEIVRALEQLPPEQREVFVRHELEGQSFEEIAAATGVRVNTLLSRKRYAVLALREILKEVYDELEE